jgi:hypothetical protein
LWLQLLFIFAEGREEKKRETTEKKRKQTFFFSLFSEQHTHQYQYTSTSTSMEEKNPEEALYSRQLYVIGRDAMKKVLSARILLCGLGGAGIEIGCLANKQKKKKKKSTTY